MSLTVEDEALPPIDDDGMFPELPTRTPQGFQDGHYLSPGEIISHTRRREAESNKENDPRALPRRANTKSLLNSQPGATRIGFDSQSTSDGFQTDNQAHSPGRKRRRDESPPLTHQPARQPSPQPTRQPAPQPTRQLIPHPTPQYTQRAPPSAPQSTHQPTTQPRIRSSRDRDERRQLPTESQEPGEVSDPESVMSRYKDANSTAKANRAKMSGVKPPQRRHAWTERETNLLIDLIGEHGTSWAVLKREDKMDVLARRDQVALKDKARNIRFDFEK